MIDAVNLWLSDPERVRILSAASLANPANAANPRIGPRELSQVSQPAHPEDFAKVENHLRAIAKSAGLSWHRMRSDPDGIRDCDIQNVVQNWIDYTRDPRLLRAYIAAVAYRLAVDSCFLRE